VRPNLGIQRLEIADLESKRWGSRSKDSSAAMSVSGNPQSRERPSLDESMVGEMKTGGNKRRVFNNLEASDKRGTAVGKGGAKSSCQLSVASGQLSAFWGEAVLGGR